MIFIGLLSIPNELYRHSSCVLCKVSTEIWLLNCNFSDKFTAFFLEKKLKRGRLSVFFEVFYRSLEYHKRMTKGWLVLVQCSEVMVLQFKDYIYVYAPETSKICHFLLFFL